MEPLETSKLHLDVSKERPRRQKRPLFFQPFRIKSLPRFPLGRSFPSSSSSFPEVWAQPHAYRSSKRVRQDRRSFPNGLPKTYRRPPPSLSPLVLRLWPRLCPRSQLLNKA